MTLNNPLTREFQAKLGKLHGFADLVEETLIARATALNDKLSAKAERFAPEDKQEFFEYHAEDYFELADELPTILRYSVLTAADTALEVYLNNTSETYAEVNEAAVRLGDFGGTGIKRARSYLNKVAGVVFRDEGLWIAVVRLHDARNCIIHSDGIVPVSRKDLREWVTRATGIRISDSGTISLDREFTPYALTAYESFAVEFDKSCEELGLWRSVFPFESA